MNEKSPVPRLGCDLADRNDPAEIYQEASKYYRGSMERLRYTAGGADLGGHVRRMPVKSHPHVPGVRLPKPEAPPVPLLHALNARRSSPPRTSASVDLATVATLLYAGYGVTEGNGNVHRRRTAPSAGGLYPLDWYVAARDIAGVGAGIYHYDPLDHLLEPCAGADSLVHLESAVLSPDLVRRTAAVVLVTALFARSREKYGLRAYRFVLLEAGHAMQNFLLMAACLGAHATPIGGYFDSEIDEVLGINGVDESTIYAASVG
ncbi:MAG: SagB/ThcOx family dehydrogenase [Chloroflexi bacterium]|nr:SagB/ThcOx family dehydrogenase [Chloroflexota bacterium]